MHGNAHTHNSSLNGSSDPPKVIFPILLSLLFPFLLFLILTTQPARAQGFTVIHTFDEWDGAFPQAGLTMDATGNLLGTTVAGGPYHGGECTGGCGSVFRMSNRESGWFLQSLYSFHISDGLSASGRVSISEDGSLYGVTNRGGNGSCQFGCGTLYKLTPGPSIPPRALAPWDESVLYNFQVTSGWYPQGDLAFDQAGNLYATVPVGGPSNGGAVYQFTPAGNDWIANLIYSFENSYDGANPMGGVVADGLGNFYGVTEFGGAYGLGTIYELSWSGSTWTQRNLWNFRMPGGAAPVGGLILVSGYLYGTTTEGGANGGGTVFQFSPGGIMRVLYDLPPQSGGSLAKLAMDDNGNLYGTAPAGGVYGWGSVFKLVPGTNRWTYNSLHDFTGQGGSDGAYPWSNIVFDNNGNLYGTASEGGTYNVGTVWKITAN